MKWLVFAFVLPIAWALKDDTYFMGCSLQPLTGNPTGLVACIMGVTSTNNSLMCSVQYDGLVGNINGVDIRKYSGRTSASTSYGVLIDLADSIASAPAQSGTFDAVVLETTTYNKDTTPVTWAVTQPANAYNASWGDFKTNLLGCFAETSNCILTVRTDTNPTGELSCFLTELIYAAEFEFPLSVNASESNSQASGYAYLNWFVTDYNTYTAKSVWAYAVDYNQLSSFVYSAGLYNGGGPFPLLTSSPTIAMNINGADAYEFKSGSIVGVAIQGSTGNGLLGQFGGYNLGADLNYAFLTNCSVDYCYVGVSSVLNPGYLELRGQLVAGVGQLVPSLLLLLALVVALLF